MHPAVQDPRALALRIESAQAEQLDRTGRAGATSLRIAGGRSVFKGPRSPFSAAVGIGLAGPVGAEDVDRIEAHLGPGGGPVRIEVGPWSDPSLAAELARRGYQIERFHQVWWRPPLPVSPPPADVEVRPIRPGEERAWIDLFAQAYLGRPVRSEAQAEAFLAMTRAEGNVCFFALDGGVPVAVAIASATGGLALLSGAGVPAAFRGRGLQLALVQARLAWAAEQRCDVVASATEPGTASQSTLERAGFRCAYPKVVMVRAGGFATAGSWTI